MILDVLLVQSELVWESPEANLANHEALIRAAAPANADVILLPEMFTSGFTPQPERVACPIEGYATAWMARLAAEYNAHVMGSFVEALGDAFYNTAICVHPSGELLATYRKVHLFGPEKKGYTAGERIPVFALNGVPVAMMICYDLRFPELFRAAAKAGAKAFFLCANWPDVRQAHWELLTRARALDNQAYLVCVNRVGRDPKLGYDGGSGLIRPTGEVGERLDNSPRAVHVTLDAGEVDAFRAQLGALADRRDDLYADWYAKS